LQNTRTGGAVLAGTQSPRAGTGVTRREYWGVCMSSLQEQMIGPRQSVAEDHYVLTILVFVLIIGAVLAVSVATPDVLIAWANPV
jgi:hypothetical protein